ncbi:MAG: hypothetical protein IKI24_07080 [Clostridia bacterium]|nr:hypothetical protein [Clostridia bacterium]
MAKSRSGSKGGASPAWRAVMLVYAVIFFKLLPLYEIRTLEFIYPRLMDAIGVGDYTLSFIVAGACAAGLLLVMFAPVSKRWLLAAGLILFMTPVWLIGDGKAGAMDAWAYAGFPDDALKLLFAALLSLWALVVVRGESKSSLKGVLAGALIAVDVMCYVYGSKPLYWSEINNIMCLALITGFFADTALNGFCPGALVPALVCAAQLALIYLDQSRALTLWITLGLSVAGAVILAWKKPKGSLGGVFALTGFAVNTALMLTRL